MIQPEKGVIALAGHDERYWSALELALPRREYEIRRFRAIEDLRRSLRQALPALIIAGPGWFTPELCEIPELQSVPIMAAPSTLVGSDSLAAAVDFWQRAGKLLPEPDHEPGPALFENLMDGLAMHEMIFDARGKPDDYRFLAINPAFERITGVTAARALGKTVKEVLPGTESHWIETYGQVVLTGRQCKFENHHAGLGKWFEVVAYRTAPGRFATLFRDITDQKSREAQNARMNALYVLLSQTHQAAARAGGRDALLQSVCDAALESGQFSLAWIETSDPACGAEHTLASHSSMPEGVFPIRPGLALRLRAAAEGFFGTAEINLLEEVSANLSLALDRMEQEALRQQAEESLRQEHAMFEMILEHTLAGYWEWRIRDDDGFLSPTLKRMFGYEDDELSGRPADWQALILEEDRPRMLEAFGKHVASRGTVPFYSEVRYRHKDGSTVWVACSGKVIEWSDSGAPVRAIGCHVDITVRKQTEELLRSSEILYRTLFESAEDAILLHKDAGRLVAANPAAEERLGYSGEELLRMQPAGIIAPESRGDFERMLNALRTDGRSVAELNHLAKDGRRIPVEITATSFPLAGETLVLSIARDATERKRVEAALRQSEEKFFQAFEHAPMVISISSLDDGTYLEVNRKWEELSGYRRQEAIGRNPVELGVLSAEESEWLVRMLRETGQVEAREALLRARDGSRAICSYNAQTIVIGGSQRVLWIGSDISYRKRYEEERELMLSILRLANAPNDTRELIRAVTTFLQEWSGCEAVGIRLQDGGDYPYYESRGFSKEFVLAERSLCAATPAQDGVTALECFCGAVLTGSTAGLKSSMSRNGSFWTNAFGELLASLTPADLPPAMRGRCHRESYQSLALVPLHFAGRSIGLMQFNDRRKGRFSPETILLFERAAASIATALEQRRVQAALKASEERYRLISENTVDVIWLWDLNSGRFSYVSPSVERLCGYTSEEILSLGAPRSLLDDDGLARIAAEIPARVAAVERGERNRIWTDRADHRHKKGSMVPTEVVTTLLTDEQGRMSGILGVSRDITERRRAEQQREALEQQLQQAQKLESVGRLAGGVAHDFNNLLTVINGYGDLALRSLKDGDPLKRQVTEMRRAGERAAALTSQLLAFSRRQMAEPRVLNLNDLILESRDMLKHLLGETIEFVLQLSPGVGPVMADPGQMHQILMNLVVNARDAMAHGGKLTIETGNAEVDEPPAGVADAKSGAYVTFTVSDTGCGMDENILRRAFEPFFTTKTPGKGTGLGLSTVYGIARQCGGWVSAESEPGHGTLFRVHLPRVEPAFLPAPVSEAADSEADGEETILVVEDQPEVRRLAVVVLKSYGYRTIEAASGAEALSLLEGHPEKVHLMLTDVVMPHMTGLELASRVADLRPGIKVLFMSGYTGAQSQEQPPLDHAADFLPKPFTPQELTDKVRASLGPGKSQAGRCE